MKKIDFKSALIGAAVATIATTSLGVANAATKVFTDVNSSAWYSNAVSWAADNGIMNGVGQNQFSPDQALTRAQLAQVLKNLSDKGMLNGTNAATSNGNSTTIVNAPANESGRVGNYTFSNYSLDNSNSYSTKVIGEIKNNDNNKHNVTFKVNFYDATGKLLGSASGYALDIQPGQIKTFEAYAMPRINGIATYAFQIETEL